MNTTNTANNGTDLHVVFGANGQVGAQIVRALVAQGKRVRAANRSGNADVPAGVEVVKADATNRDQVIAAAAGARVIYHAMGAPVYSAKVWQQTLPIYMDHLIVAAGDAGARLVYVDNLYMYGKPDGPMTETSPIRPIEGKGIVRAAVARTLIEEHERGRVEAVLGRASDFYGPGATNSIQGMFVFANIAAGKTPQWPANLDMPHTSSYVGDFARGIVTLGLRPEAAGEVWHIPAAEPLMGREFITLAMEEAGLAPKAATLPTALLQLAGLFNVAARESAKMAYEFAYPYVMDGSKFTRAFGGQPTPHREAIRQTIAGFRQRARQPAVPKARKATA